MNIGDKVTDGNFIGIVVGARTLRELDPITDDTHITFDTADGMSCERRAGDLTVMESATQEVLDAQVAFIEARTAREKRTSTIAKEQSGAMWAAYSNGMFLALCPDVAFAKTIPGVDAVRPAVVDGAIVIGVGDLGEAVESVVEATALIDEQADELRVGINELDDTKI